MRRLLLIAGVLLAAAWATPALAQAASSPLQVTATPLPSGSTSYSVPIQTLLFFTLLTFLPALMLMMTSFTRIIIVLSLLRMALGTQTTPPNQVLIGLALFLTFFIMGPVFDQMHDKAWVPYRDNSINFNQALNAGAEPLKQFMLHHTRESDLELFTRIAQANDEDAPAVAKAEDVPLRIIIPAYATSELKTAFQIGFLVFIPFLIIDLVVASVLMSMGMMMLSPVLIALPFKLMLFVLADGWSLLIGSLVASFQIG
ncbi:MAG TPA: flagellar type III secretion system pore protein FliP [Burkholderiaceae bacterium]|nr:flagellar type III secretion system pore protein FliP [Burkholderiaceae bacterium]